MISTSDLGQQPPLRCLAAGEQQEFALRYDLLFRVPANTVVLIDEPERSLHLAWQKQLLADLLGIASLSKFDAIVASHSPFVAGGRTDLTIGLGVPVQIFAMI